MAEGYVHSIETLGALDGPGVRFVVFLRGCNLRCGCCHNPDTWDEAGAKKMTAEEIVKRALRYREYFGREGGITLSGGEPLCQAEFAREIFALSKAAGLNTCLDTSGSILNEDVKALLSHTDRVLLDVKYTDDVLYRMHVGCTIYSVLSFLEYLNERSIPTTVRQVILPGLNDDESSVLKLKEIAMRYECVDKVELLPFKKMCKVKYERLGIDFPFKDVPEPTKKKMDELQRLLGE